MQSFITDQIHYSSPAVPLQTWVGAQKHLFAVFLRSRHHRVKHSWDIVETEAKKPYRVEKSGTWQAQKEVQCANESPSFLISQEKSDKSAVYVKPPNLKILGRLFSFKKKQQHDSVGQTKHPNPNLNHNFKVFILCFREVLGMWPAQQRHCCPSKEVNRFFLTCFGDSERVSAHPAQIHSGSINWLRTRVMVLLMAFGFPVLGLALWAVPSPQRYLSGWLT